MKSGAYYTIRTYHGDRLILSSEVQKNEMDSCAARLTDAGFMAIEGENKSMDTGICIHAIKSVWYTMGDSQYELETDEWVEHRR